MKSIYLLLTGSLLLVLGACTPKPACYEAAQQGNAKAQFELSQKYYKGDSIKKDTAQAIYWLDQSARRGYSDAQLFLASCYSEGKGGIAKNADEAAYWYEKVAMRGNVEAQLFVGDYYYEKHYYDRALSWFKKAAEKGNALAHYKIGMYYYETADYSHAADWFLKAIQRKYPCISIIKELAEKGYAEAQTVLGICYRWGMGVNEDYKEAVKWWLKAAEQRNFNAYSELGLEPDLGQKSSNRAFKMIQKAVNQDDLEAIYRLGNCYRNGDDGFTQDYPKAVYWYQLAADRGHADAQFFLAGCYFQGNGVSKDVAKALSLWQSAANKGHHGAKLILHICMIQGFSKYREAAEQGDAEAQAVLGYCYQSGEVVDIDHQQAFYWYMKSAEQGFAEGQYGVGRCYYLGLGVPKDLSKAVYWFEKAAAQGSEDAVRMLRKIDE